MARESKTNSGGSPRIAIHEPDLDKLLREHAPDEPASTQLEQLILDLQLSLRRGLLFSVRAQKGERRERLNYLRQVEPALEAGARLLGRRAGPGRRAVGDILGAELARLLADQAFADAGFSVDEPTGRELGIIRSRAREPERAVAEEMRGRRAKLAPHSAAVLAGFFARCHALIAAQLEIERGDKGGRPSNPEREYILASIAIHFEDVFGIAPTSSETGAYVSLSSDVLELFGLETHGVEYAAKRVLKRLRQGAASRSKPRR